MKEETKETILARHDFTNAEKLSLSHQLAFATQQVSSLEDQKRQITSDFKAKIDEQAARTASLATKIANGYEYRDTLCRVEFVTANGVKRCYRCDNGDFVKEESMTQADFQRNLPLDDSKKPSENADPPAIPGFKWTDQGYCENPAAFRIPFNHAPIDVLIAANPDRGFVSGYRINDPEDCDAVIQGESVGRDGYQHHDLSTATGSELEMIIAWFEKGARTGDKQARKTADVLRSLFDDICQFFKPDNVVPGGYLVYPVYRTAQAEASKGSPEDNEVDQTSLDWLTRTPVGDDNFKSALLSANMGTLKAALDSGKLPKTARKKVEAQLTKLIEA